MKVSRTSHHLAYGVWLSLCLALAALIWSWALPQQIARACWISEWPFEEGCSDSPTRAAADNSPEVYLKQLQHNIGDGHSWAKLTSVLWRSKDPQSLTILPWARQFAPYNAQLLAVEAEAALQAKDWPRLANALVAMIERGHREARPMLAALMQTPEAQDAVLATLNSDSRWLDGMLASIDAKVSAVSLEPFVSKGRQLDILRYATVLSLIERLQREGNWLDAYTLWVALRGKVAEGLFNAGFDQRSTQRAFDWRWPDENKRQRGLRVSQVSAAPQTGFMMEVEMTGRTALPQPMMSQPVVLLGQRYQLSGRYMSDRMRTDEGLVWALRCAASGGRFAQSTAMKDTSRKWASFAVEVNIPPECGGAVKLQLETTEAWEAKAGMAGVIYLDDLELKPMNAGEKQ